MKKKNIPKEAKMEWKHITKKKMLRNAVEILPLDSVIESEVPQEERKAWVEHKPGQGDSKVLGSL